MLILKSGQMRTRQDASVDVKASSSISHRSTTTSAVIMTAMRPDCVVQAGQHPVRLDPHPGLVLWGGALPGRVFLPVQAGTATKPTLRSRRPDELDDRLVTDQRLPGPVAADQAEHAVFDRVP